MAEKDTIYVPATTRLAVKEDESFIFHSWLKSYRSSWAMGTNPMRYVNKDIYYQNQKQIINSLLADSYVIVAHNVDDVNQLFGYIVAQPSGFGVCIVHYMFVKQPFRNLGIGTMLLNKAKDMTGHVENSPLIATHATGVLHASLAKKYNVIYNPFVIYMEHFYENESFKNGAND